MAFDWREDLDMDSPEFNLAEMVEELTYNWSDSHRSSTFTAQQLFDMHTTPELLRIWVPFFKEHGYNFDLATIKKGLELLRQSGDVSLDGEVYTSHETSFWGHLADQDPSEIVVRVEEISTKDPDAAKLYRAMMEKGLRSEGALQYPPTGEGLPTIYDIESTEEFRGTDPSEN